ncbi:hypothetical protein TrCOL_g8657 [Triparma columacea]|uniref:thermospermine synthase n=1 Tax=Triparma columacea TaxID=722753 RepID=A0A9W7FWC5_9STRA|nr:hypothetical protein TrCOL_g8657 [Triparma columacea]
MTIESERDKAGFWFEEDVLPGLKVKMELKEISFNGNSKFQQVQVIKTIFGKTLVTDGKTQSAESDEKIYHESLVVPAMLKHGSPKRVFIGGGGELATARECLRFPSVEEVVMVDIDEVVVNICKEHLPTWGDGCWDDPRLNLIIGDAYSNFENMDGQFDVVIMDISDPIEAGPGIALYTKEFYDMVASKLSPGGVFVTQSGSGDVHNYDDCMTAINRTCREVFDCVAPYTSSVPSFGGNWGFNMAWNLGEGEEGKEEIKKWKTCSDIEAKIQASSKHDYIFYDGETHLGMFNPAKQLRRGLEKEERVITRDNPVFMY